ncbi:MAG: hypothetical protein KDA75_18820, partial [Planctomycetaceae bacterium]|nr:hypothetical protein [Planctomycetaceae bacterium]
MARRTAIVVTTIFEPSFLTGYLQSVLQSGRQKETVLYVIGDRKTPRSVWGACRAAQRGGFCIQCPTLEEQTDYLRHLGLPEDFIPWNSDNRRNIGFLMALDDGAEVIISIDDDNFCDPQMDYIG